MMLIWFLRCLGWVGYPTPSAIRRAAAETAAAPPGTGHLSPPSALTHFSNNSPKLGMRVTASAPDALAVITIGVLQTSWCYRKAAIDLMDDEKVFAWSAAFDRLLDQWLCENPGLAWKISESLAA